MTFAPSLSVSFFLKRLRVEDKVQGWGAELEETGSHSGREKGVRGPGWGFVSLGQLFILPESFLFMK